MQLIGCNRNSSKAGKRGAIKRRHGLASSRMPLALLFLMVSVSTSAIAFPPPNITQNETALLPKYCLDTQTWPGGNPNGMERGKAVYGEVFWHFHHYCYAMIWQMRAERANASVWERRGGLVNAVDDLDYVLRNMPPDHFLLPEMLTRKGKALRMLSRTSEALEVLRQAASLDATYSKAYAELAICYDLIGDRQQAIAALKEGLTSNPKAKALLLHLAELERKPGGAGQTPGNHRDSPRR